jgi:tRNA U34 2-thiouridine synthase MnmA/TrmU
MTGCIVMFSGGLDSAIAAHLLKSQGLAVTALHFVLPFKAGLGFSHESVKERAAVIGVPLKIVDEGEEYLAMVLNPAFGYGSHANPCIDCRIHRLKKAARIMQELGASFIATGEVVGQRPMSQRRHCMDLIERRSGLEGLLLRPLSAQMLEPTVPEQNGWVDRSRLLGITGRGRKEQLAYAKKFGLTYGTPAGGCILTEKHIAGRFRDLRESISAVTLSDFKLLAYGRHFRLHNRARLIVGRDDGENTIIQKLSEPCDLRFLMETITGPLALGRGEFTEQDIQTAAAIVARYSKGRDKVVSRVQVIKNGLPSVLEVKPAAEGLCEEKRI